MTVEANMELFRSIENYSNRHNIDYNNIKKILIKFIGDDIIVIYYLSKNVTDANKEILIDLIAISNETFYGFSYNKQQQCDFYKTKIKDLYMIDDEPKKDIMYVNMAFNNKTTGWRIEDSINNRGYIKNFILDLLSLWSL